MSKWKIFDKNKQKKDETLEPEEPETKEPIEDKTEEQNVVTYSETLHTAGSSSKKKANTKSNQRTWRDVGAIEEKVDNLHITRAQRPVTQLDKTVDRLIDKRKKK